MDNTLQLKLREAGYEGEFDLESLILGCGDGQLSISRIPDAFNGWKAIARDGEARTIGETPKIAVAKLIIDLKNKKEVIKKPEITF